MSNRLYTNQSLEDAKCMCGNGVGDFWVSAESWYHPILHFLGVMLGMAPGPQRIRFKCRKCGDIIAESRDPDIILLYRNS